MKYYYIIPNNEITTDMVILKENKKAPESVVKTNILIKEKRIFNKLEAETIISTAYYVDYNNKI